MFTPSPKVHLKPQLSLLYKCCYYLGLIHFKYNCSTKRFEQSTLNFHVTLVIYSVFKYICGAIISVSLAYLVQCYIQNKRIAGDTSRGIEAQDSALKLLSAYEPIFSIFVYSSNYLRHKRRIRPLLNEMLDISHQIRRHTKAPLCYDFSFHTVLVLKVGLVVVILRNYLFQFSITYFLYTSPFIVIIVTLKTVMILSHIYSQLVLVGFYMNMSEVLAATGSALGDSELKYRVSKLISISLRIRGVKRRLDATQSAVFTVTFGNLFNDVYHVYDVLRLMFYGTQQHLDVEIWSFFNGFVNNFFAAILGTLDMYIVGIMSSMLVKSEREFQRRILEVVVRSGFCLQENVELMMYQSWIYDLSTVAYGNIRVNPEFSFDCTVKIVVYFVIAFLQFFASKKVYSLKGDA